MADALLLENGVDRLLLEVNDGSVLLLEDQGTGEITQTSIEFSEEIDGFIRFD